MNLPATVHLDSQVDFLPAVAGLTVRLIIVINRGKELIDMIYYLQQFHLCSKSRMLSAVVNQSSDKKFCK